MKKSKKSLILILAAAAILSMLLTIPVLAASTRKCYLIKNQNTTVYSNTALTKKYGTVYGSDEIKFSPLPVNIQGSHIRSQRAGPKQVI